MAVTMESALGTLVYPRPSYPSYSRFSQPGLWPKCPPEEDYNHYNASFYASNGKARRGNYTINPEWLSEDVNPADFTRSKWKPWPYEYPGARDSYQHPNAQGWTVAEVKLGHRADPHLAQPGYSPYTYVPIMHRDELKNRWAWNEKQALLDPRAPQQPPTYEEVLRQKRLHESFGLGGIAVPTNATYGAFSRRPQTAGNPPRSPQILGSLNAKVNPMPMRDVVKAGLDQPKSASFSLLPENFSSVEKNPRENPNVRSAAEPLPTVKLPFPVDGGCTPHLTTHYPNTFIADFENCKVRHMGNKYISGYMTRCDWG